MNKLAVENNYETLTYEFSSDYKYLKQYADLVIEYYRKELKLDLEGHNMAMDLCQQKDNEKVFIVRDGDKVVAGAKLTFSQIGSDNKLPMESDSFQVDSVLPDNFNEKYVEYGRLVVDPDYRGKEVLSKMIDLLTYYSYRHYAGYIFVLAPPLNSVLYRRVCRSLGMDVALHKDVNWGTKDAYNHLNLQLLSCDIRNLYLQQKQDSVVAV